MLKKLLILTFIATLSFAQHLKIGDTLTPFILKDQFDKEHTINTDKYKMFLVSFSKDSSDKVDQFLKDKEKNFLEKNNIVYISDIHRMPSLITSLFALPKMRDYPYTVMLMYEKNKIFPQHDESLSVIKFKNNKVNSIEFIQENERIDAIFH